MARLGISKTVVCRVDFVRSGTTLRLRPRSLKHDLKSLATLWFVGCLVLTVTVAAEEMSLDRQREFIERYMYITGQTTTLPAALTDPVTGEPYPEKCGTPAILDFQRNRDSFDRRLMAALNPQDVSRPTTQAEYGIPGGHTLIHYDTSGTHAVWQAVLDSDADGVPDFVESLASIADSCYVHIVDTLGYPRPLVDSSCVGGGDERVDIYLRALPYGLYGMTYNQSECYEPDIQHEAAWVVIDHDFQNIPQYVGRPLDGARVSLAHELIHTVHLAIDATEHISWFEMSAVWMEEEIYDEINDYYYYDYAFFDNPRAALHDLTVPGHMYQAAVFPIYLSEKYGPDAIKAVWQHAGALGAGPDFLEAFDEVIDSASQDPANARYKCLCYNVAGDACLDSVLVSEDFASAMAEFSVWNFFTGPYTDQAPKGIGYSEAINYACIPLDSMDMRRNYPVFVDFDHNRFEPAPNGATYIRLENLRSIDVDTLLTGYIFPDQDAIVRWGVSGIFQMESDPDSFRVVTNVVDLWETWICLNWSCTDSVCTEWDGPDCLNWTCTDSVCVDLRLFPGKYLESILGEWVCIDGDYGAYPVCGQSTCRDSVRIIDLLAYRSLTIILTPTTVSPGPYAFDTPVEFSYSIWNKSKPCCSGRVGDGNGLGVYPDEITLGDIMMLVDAKFISESCDNITCLTEADVNQSGGTEPTCEDITLLDIMILVDFLFIHPETAVLLECL